MDGRKRDFIVLINTVLENFVGGMDAVVADEVINIEEIKGNKWR